MSAPIIQATRGSDVRLAMTWQDGDGNAVSLASSTLSILDEPQALQGRISVIITNAALGQFQVLVEGSSPIEYGVHQFRVVRTVSGSDSIATPLIGVRVL